MTNLYSTFDDSYKILFLPNYYAPATKNIQTILGVNIWWKVQLFKHQK